MNFFLFFCFGVQTKFIYIYLFIFLGARAPIGIASVRHSLSNWSKSFRIVKTCSILLSLAIGVNGCYKGVLTDFPGISMVLHGCYKSVTRVLQGCYMGVSRMFQGFFKGVTRVLPGVFWWCNKGVTRMLQGCYICVSRMFKGFSRVLQGCRMDVELVKHWCYTYVCKGIARVL